MPTCQQCGQEWTWKETLKATFTLSHVLHCPYCKQKQFITSTAKKKLNMLNFIIPLTLLLFLFIDVALIFKLGMLFGIGGLIIVLYPFLIQLTNDDEPIF